jgi:hypothetical protein
MNAPKGSVEAVRRKLKALKAVTSDAGATESERANADALKARLERRLKDAGAPTGDWTDALFRLGQRVKEIGKVASSASLEGDWTKDAYRLGKAVRRGFKRWGSN